MSARQDGAAADAAPLHGIRVVDFTHVIAGPFATQVLGDLGASVVKIEGIDRGDIGRDMAPMKNGQSHYFVTFNRNKRSIALDLKSAAGRNVALALLRDADVVIENFAPGVMRRLGLGYEDVRAINPAAVYCSISGFGQTGPLAHKRSLDLIAQAYSGIMSANGTADAAPLKIGVPIGDTASSLFAAIGILAALHRRRDTGAGQFIDVAMYDSLLTLLANHGGYFNATGRQPERAGSGHYFTVPYGTFEAADGEIAIAVMTDANWAGLCQALGLDELGADPALRTLQGRAAQRERVYAAVRPAIARLAVAELVERLGAADVPCAPVNDIGAALEHPHTAARDMLLHLEHPRYGAIRATSMPLRDVMRERHQAPPLRGEHTAEVLRELGLAPSDIAALLAAGHAWQHAPASEGD
ncbi:CaiB/BaiF CoA-transferase family protein [Pigmentiphaga soli]|uniref:CaiB/BaiF CoA-transferase family protein n=1 Tax=Pigmentiphaga soli TaxID=1007095 RepID=A0ABP8GKJ3_9BURK